MKITQYTDASVHYQKIITKFNSLKWNWHGVTDGVVDNFNKKLTSGLQICMLSNARPPLSLCPPVFGWTCRGGDFACDKDLMQHGSRDTSGAHFLLALA